MKLTAEACPCGCSKFIVKPLFGSVDASLPKEEADELVKRWNAFEPKFAPGNYAPPGEYLATIGSKGGKKKGVTKKRGDAKHYRDMANTRWEKPK